LNSQSKNVANCFNDGNEKLVEDQEKTALADTGSQVIMLCSRMNPENIEKKSHQEKSNGRTIYSQIIYVTRDNQENRPIHTDCFDNGNEKLVQDQIKIPASAVSGSQVIMLCSRRSFDYITNYRTRKGKKKLFENRQAYYLQEVRNTIEDIENSEPENQEKTEKNDDLNCFDKDSDLLIKDQITTPALAVSGFQLITLSYSENHEKPYGTVEIYRNGEREVTAP
jgi:hypothetical protein